MVLLLRPKTYFKVDQFSGGGSPPHGLTSLASDVQLPVSTLSDFVDGGKKLPNEALDRLTKRLWPGTQYVGWQDVIERVPSTATSMGIPPAPYKATPPGVIVTPPPQPGFKPEGMLKPHKAAWEDEDE